LFASREDAPDNFFRSGEVLEKKKSWKKVIKLYERFIKTYRKNPEQREKLVVARLKIAEALGKTGDRRKSRKEFLETYKQYKKFKLDPGGKAAEAAANARFQLIEIELKKYEAINFAVPAKKLEKTLKKKAVTLKKMEEKYKEVFSFKRVQWTLASYYRLGYLYENFANVLVSAPCPRGFNAEECDIYQGKLMDYSEAPIRKAVSAYELTMEKSKQLKLVNRWSKMAYVGLNKYEPIRYPLQKEAQEALVIERFGPLPMMQTVESGIKPSGK